MKATREHENENEAASARMYTIIDNIRVHKARFNETAALMNSKIMAASE
jgi:hypothetical protein